MLTQAWAQVPDTPWRVAQFQRNASLLHYLAIGGAVGEQHLTVLHLRVSEDFGDGVHRTDTDGMAEVSKHYPQGSGTRPIILTFYKPR
jgi:hypothetical protein